VKVFQQFSKGKGDKDADPAIWGGKGAGLARMAAQGYPVPPGFTITTELCRIYQEQPEAVVEAVMLDIDEHAVALGALGCADLDAGHDGHDLECRPYVCPVPGVGEAHR
jgi:phosphoenolpyruvate synthase/pyruvate phosphate dikinase